MAKGTILVNLQRGWFGPNGVLYEAVDNPHEFPADWADEAKPVESKAAKETVTTTTTPAEASGRKYAMLPSDAEIVESQKTVAVLQNTASGQVMMPSAVQGDVKEVGGALGEHGLEESSQSVSAAAKVAKDAGLDQVGGKPAESGPLPAGTKKLA